MTEAAWQALVAQTAAGQGADCLTFHLDLSAQPTEVRHARTFLRTELAAHPQLPIDLILLLTSELVTNAMLHGRSNIEVDACIIPVTAGRGPTVLVGVTDTSAMLPQQRPRSRSNEGGRGLQIVRELADEWGWIPTGDGGKVVWFRVQAAGRDHAPAPRKAGAPTGNVSRRSEKPGEFRGPASR